MMEDYHTVLDPVPSASSAVRYPWGVIVFSPMGVVKEIRFGWTDKETVVNWTREVIRKEKCASKDAFLIVRSSAFLKTEIGIKEEHV
jgi:hypothetical protein